MQEALAGHAGTSLVRLDVTALGDEVTDDLVRVKSAAVTRSWPHGLAVALTMRVPVAQHRTDAGYEVLDGEAVVLETTEQPQSGLAEVTADEGAALTQEQVGAVAEAVGSLDSSVRPQVASGSATTTGQVTLVLSSAPMSCGGTAPIRILRPRSSRCCCSNRPRPMTSRARIVRRHREADLTVGVGAGVSQRRRCFRGVCRGCSGFGGCDARVGKHAELKCDDGARAPHSVALVIARMT